MSAIQCVLTDFVCTEVGTCYQPLFLRSTTTSLHAPGTCISLNSWLLLLFLREVTPKTEPGECAPQRLELIRHLGQKASLGWHLWGEATLNFAYICIYVYIQLLLYVIYYTHCLLADKGYNIVIMREESENPLPHFLFHLHTDRRRYPCLLSC